jgi:hypothetical protein
MKAAPKGAKSKTAKPTLVADDDDDADDDGKSDNAAEVDALISLGKSKAGARRQASRPSTQGRGGRCAGEIEAAVGRGGRRKRTRDLEGCKA